ncbi:hypothetical protein B7Y94_00125 [Candidatus Saccharibacteria bacterium 32-49-12]|nr:MAG: hypothetical protein B7Y94_00125 [Candidatus Saccharibacteria bacterium 32-49-12]
MSENLQRRQETNSPNAELTDEISKRLLLSNNLAADVIQRTGAEDMYSLHLGGIGFRSEIIEDGFDGSDTFMEIRGRTGESADQFFQNALNALSREGVVRSEDLSEYHDLSVEDRLKLAMHATATMGGIYSGQGDYKIKVSAPTEPVDSKNGRVGIGRHYFIDDRDRLKVVESVLQYGKLPEGDDPLSSDWPLEGFTVGVRDASREEADVVRPDIR